MKWVETSVNIAMTMENSDGSLDKDMRSPPTSDNGEEPIDPENADSNGEKGEELDPDFLEERFRVDRRKLEQMIQSNEKEDAEGFFDKIMKETNTQITWPSKLKIGAKSKKDPHIKISGHKDAVAEAKTKVMMVLDTKSTRVTLKMDVSYTEHSHVIGKGGNNIKLVMQQTGCHIHFPDSNRSSATAEKSNQVSIAGQPHGVELAREKIRDLLPLVFTFELPLGGGLIQAAALSDPSSSPAIKAIQDTYGVTVNVKQRTHAYTTCVAVRGTVCKAQSAKEATLRLYEQLTGQLATSPQVTVQLEIAPQHHLSIQGRGGANLQQIMQATSAVISFPDPALALTINALGSTPSGGCSVTSSSTMSSQRKSTVCVTGGIEGVCLARQHLIGLLPLVLMFDMKEDVEIEDGKVTNLMEQLNVVISIKPKPKQPSKSVIVRSVERNASALYEARRRLVGEEIGEPQPRPRATPLEALTHTAAANLGLYGHNMLNLRSAANQLLMLNGANRSHMCAATAAAVGSHLSPLVIANAGLYNPPLMLLTPTHVAVAQQRLALLQQQQQQRALLIAAAGTAHLKQQRLLMETNCVAMRQTSLPGATLGTVTNATAGAGVGAQSIVSSNVATLATHGTVHPSTVLSTSTTSKVSVSASAQPSELGPSPVSDAVPSPGHRRQQAIVSVARKDSESSIDRLSPTSDSAEASRTVNGGLVSTSASSSPRQQHASVEARPGHRDINQNKLPHSPKHSDSPDRRHIHSLAYRQNSSTGTSPSPPSNEQSQPLSGYDQSMPTSYKQQNQQYSAKDSSSRDVPPCHHQHSHPVPFHHPQHQASHTGRHVASSHHMHVSHSSPQLRRASEGFRSPRSDSTGYSAQRQQLSSSRQDEQDNQVLHRHSIPSGSQFHQQYPPPFSQSHIRTHARTSSGSQSFGNQWLTEEPQTMEEQLTWAGQAYSLQMKELLQLASRSDAGFVEHQPAQHHTRSQHSQHISIDELMRQYGNMQQHTVPTTVSSSTGVAASPTYGGTQTMAMPPTFTTAAGELTMEELIRHAKIAAENKKSIDELLRKMGLPQISDSTITSSATEALMTPQHVAMAQGPAVYQPCVSAAGIAMATGGTLAPSTLSGQHLLMEELLKSVQSTVAQYSAELDTQYTGSDGLASNGVMANFVPPGFPHEVPEVSLSLQDLIHAQQSLTTTAGHSHFDLSALTAQSASGDQTSTNLLEILLPKLNHSADSTHPQHHHHPHSASGRHTSSDHHFDPNGRRASGSGSECFAHSSGRVSNAHAQSLAEEEVEEHSSPSSSPDHPLLRSGSPPLPAHTPDSPSPPPVSQTATVPPGHQSPTSPVTANDVTACDVTLYSAQHHHHHHHMSAKHAFPFQNGRVPTSPNGEDEGSDLEGLGRPNPEQTSSLFPNTPLFDYEKEKLRASKAMAKKPVGEARVPTDYWAGMGFSKSMPDHAIREQLHAHKVKYQGPSMATTYENGDRELAEEAEEEDRDPWKNSPITSPSNSFNAGLRGGTAQRRPSGSGSAVGSATSSPRHHRSRSPPGANNPTQPAPPPASEYPSPNSHPAPPSAGHSSEGPPPPPASVGQVGAGGGQTMQDVDWMPTTDLAELFSELGLGKYTYLFQEQEVDMGTFLTLTDQDLKDLGISTFGARRRMLLAIDELNKRQLPISAAPGSNNPFRRSERNAIMQRHNIISQSGRW